MCVAQLNLPVRLRGDGFFLPGRAPVRCVRTVVNGDIAMHDQDFMEIVMVVGGTAVHRTIYGNQPISKGDVFVLRPGAWHAYQSVKDLELFECRFAMDLLQRELSWTRDDPGIELMFWAAPASLDRRGMVHLKLNSEAQQRVLEMLEELATLTDPASNRRTHAGDRPASGSRRHAGPAGDGFTSKNSQRQARATPCGHARDSFNGRSTFGAIGRCRNWPSGWMWKNRI